MTSEVFMSLLLIISVFTSLCTEAVKKQFEGANNVLAGSVSVIVSVATCVGYVIFTSATIDAKLIFSFVVLCVVGWMCSMLGYDKVIQTIKQLGGR